MTERFKEFIEERQNLIDRYRPFYELNDDAEIVITAMAISNSVEYTTAKMMFCEYVHYDAFYYTHDVDKAVLDFLISVEPENADCIKEIWENEEYDIEDFMEYIERKYGAYGVACYCIKKGMDTDWAEDLIIDDLLIVGGWGEKERIRRAKEDEWEDEYYAN